LNGYTPEALRLLVNHSWPGNVRELENAIERAVVLCKSEWVDDRALSFLSPGEATAAGDIRAQITRWEGSLQMQVDSFEKSVLQEILELCNGNRSQAARKLSINRTTLLAKIKKHNLESEIPEVLEV
jgi:two-component system response regulator HydG